MDETALLRFHLDRFDDFLTLEQGASGRTIEAYRRDVARLVDFARTRAASLPSDITSKLLR